jgi:transposase
VLFPSEQQRPAVQEQRRVWREQQLNLPIQRLVFIDETALRTNLTRRSGRAPCGQRVLGYVPYGHWKTTTFISALRHDRLTAPMVVDGAMTGAIFQAYLQQVLLPTLQDGDLVVMDNLACHKSVRVSQLLESVGARACYLPPYSPDLNPIELAYSKFKALLRGMQIREVEQLWQTSGKLLERFNGHECQNYLRHAGYTFIAA